MFKTGTSGMVVAAVLATVSLLAVARAEGPGALSPKDLFAKASPAVGRIEVCDSQGKLVSTGSGFFVSQDGLLVTNYHVIADAASAKITFADKTQRTILGVVASDPKQDLAILRIEGKSPAFLELATGVPAIGTKVYAIGSPEGLTNTLSDGLVSGIRQIEGISLIQTSAPITHGSSGGPLLTDDAKVVGVSAAGKDGAGNIGLAVTATYLPMLLAMIAAPQPFPGTVAGKTISLSLGKGITMTLMQLPAGKFTMGSPDGEKDRGPYEGPQREVTISKAFYMGVYEVTQEQYEAVIGKNPSEFKGAKNPVECVSWDDAVEFCKKLSAKTGKRVRLPTEAEWEYACRAGTKTRFSFGDDDADLHKYGNYCDKSNTDGMRWQDKEHNDGHDKTAPVGSYKPNAWGLYDMHGNVSEWCSDWFVTSYANAGVRDPQGPASSGGFRVMRGGCYLTDPQDCRSAYREGGFPYFRLAYYGFRVVSVGAVGMDSK